MTQKRLLLLIWISLPIAALAQNLQLIDSIKSHIPQEKNQNRFDLLNDLSWEYRFAYPDSTIFYSKLAYDLGLKLNLQTGLARAINFMGIAYNYQGERLKAFEFYSKAMEIAVRQNDSLQIAHSNNNFGRLFYDQGMLSRSYEYFVAARSIFTAIRDSSGMAYTCQSLANLYKSQRDYEKAENNFLEAYRLRLALGNPRDIMSAMVYIGRHYQESNQASKSIRFFLLADSTGHVINDEINLAEIKTFLAESYLAIGRLKDAEDICKKGLAVILKKNNVRMMPQGYNTMGQILLQRNDLAKAKEYFLMSLDIAKRIKDLSRNINNRIFG